MAVTMELGGLDLAPNFPIFGRAFDIIRPDDQGPSIRKMIITLSGFIEDDNHEAVMQLYEILKSTVGVNDTTFSFADGSTTFYNDQPVYIQSYNEPQDQEFAKYGAGDYSIEFYYYEDNNDSIPIICTYGSYTFEKVPTWGREITPNRETHRAELFGSTAQITLQGLIFADDHAALLTKIEALRTALSVDDILTYGNFSQAVKVGRQSIQPVTLRNYAVFSLEFFYDIGDIVSLRRKITFSRIHNHPVITEEPFCDRRIIELMNTSGQTINYSVTIEASNITTARALLIPEATALIQPGGIELEGGNEEWDYDSKRISLNITKFYDTPVMQNLPGTG